MKHQLVNSNKDSHSDEFLDRGIVPAEFDATAAYLQQRRYEQLG